MGVMEELSLDGKKAIVTGGSRGIGKGIATGLAEAGADVALVFRSSVDLAEQLADKFRDMNRDSFALQADVSDKSKVKAMVQQVIEKWGRIDVLVNNAGIVINAPAEEMTEDEWDQVLNVDLKGVFLCSQMVGQKMIEQGGGSIINVGSMSGYIANYPQPQVSYNSAKAGVHTLTKCLATEWAPHNIRVNAIAPGYIETDMTRPFLEGNSEDVQRYWIEGAVMERVGQPHELAGTAVLLASDASSFITGEVVVVDGGYTLR